MSLFQAREYWSTSNSSGEHFGFGTMCLGNVDNEKASEGTSPGDNTNSHSSTKVLKDVTKIVIGSLEGKLRIYGPTGRTKTKENMSLNYIKSYADAHEAAIDSLAKVLGYEGLEFWTEFSSLLRTQENIDTKVSDHLETSANHFSSRVQTAFTGIMSFQLDEGVGAGQDEEKSNGSRKQKFNATFLETCQDVVIAAEKFLNDISEGTGYGDDTVLSKVTSIVEKKIIAKYSTLGKLFKDDSSIARKKDDDKAEENDPESKPNSSKSKIVDASFKAEDLLLEEDLQNGPILQVEIGSFTTAGKNSLLVLHPKVVVAYDVVTTPNTAGDDTSLTSFTELRKLFSKKLGYDIEVIDSSDGGDADRDDGDRPRKGNGKQHWSSYNMTVGNFGGNTNQLDSIAVQSLDGRIQIFDSDGTNFIVEFDDVLVPGPLCYASHIDSFITTNSQMEISCYKYYSLSKLAKTNKDRKVCVNNFTTLSTNKNKLRDWCVNSGEFIHHIEVARVSKSIAATEKDIVAVGEFSIFFITENGLIRYMKRCDYIPSAVTTYIHTPILTQGGNANLIVTTNDAQMLIYSQYRNVWSAKLSQTPVAIKVGSFFGTKGFIVLLSASGNLQIVYLGTDPPSQTVQAQDRVREESFEDMEREHLSLLRRIRNSHRKPSSKTTQSRILLRVHLPETLESSSSYSASSTPLSIGGDQGMRSAIDLGPQQASVPTTASCEVDIFVSYTGEHAAKEIDVIVSCPKGISASPCKFRITDLHGNSDPFTQRVRFTYTAQKGHLLSSLKAKVIAVTSGHSGGTNVKKSAFEEFQLPFALVAQTVMPVKEASYMITLNRKALPLMKVLFSDLLLQQNGCDPRVIEMTRGVQSNVISFCYRSGHIVTILGSKSGDRMRIQSHSFAALALITLTLNERLSKLPVPDNKRFESSHSPIVVSDGNISFTSKLPLGDLFNCIDKHYMARKQLVESEKTLANYSEQHRNIQKRLLVRFKEVRKPQPLNNLDILLNTSYQNIVGISHEYEKCLEALDVASGEVRLDEKNFVLLKAHLSPDVHECESGWEETTDANMTHLLRTSLASAGTKATVNTASRNVLKFPSNTTKLKKHLKLVIEKLNKGVRFFGELALIGVVGASLLGRKDVPKLTRIMGRYTGKMVTSAVHFKENAYTMMKRVQEEHTRGKRPQEMKRDVERLRSKMKDVERIKSELASVGHIDLSLQRLSQEIGLENEQGETFQTTPNHRKEYNGNNDTRSGERPSPENTGEPVRETPDSRMTRKRPEMTQNQGGIDIFLEVLEESRNYGQ
eukprot:g1496.t1